MAGGYVLSPEARREIQDMIRRERLRIQGIEKPVRMQRQVVSDVVYMGVASEAIPKGGSGTVRRWVRIDGVRTDTEEDYECDNDFADVSSGGKVAFTLDGDTFVILSGECS